MNGHAGHTTKNGPSESDGPLEMRKGVMPSGRIPRTHNNTAATGMAVVVMEGDVGIDAWHVHDGTGTGL